MNNNTQFSQRYIDCKLKRKNIGSIASLHVSLTGHQSNQQSQKSAHRTNENNQSLNLKKKIPP